MLYNVSEGFSRRLEKILLQWQNLNKYFVFNNYSPQAQWILLSNPRNHVEEIVQ